MALFFCVLLAWFCVQKLKKPSAAKLKAGKYRRIKARSLAYSWVGLILNALSIQRANVSLLAGGKSLNF